MPRTKSPAGTTVDKRNGRSANLVAVQGNRLETPEGLSDEALAVWDSYWTDPVSSVATAVDRPVILRWITELDRSLRLATEADKEPVVRGSQGQPVENPLYSVSYRALNVVMMMERQLGIGPLWRSNLGIAIVSESKSLADMNAKYSGGGGGRDAPRLVAESDPRVIDA